MTDGGEQRVRLSARWSDCTSSNVVVVVWPVATQLATEQHSICGRSEVPLDRHVSLV